VRKELIRSTSSTFPDDEGFRFRHLLIRDAAYESLPKATRAELHERFADWLAQHDLVESDEIVGYHLEQAHRYRVELDTGDPALAGLADRAAGALSAAGLGAMDRGDWVAARSLLRRACQLLPKGSDARAALAPDLALTLQEVGENDEALTAAEEAALAGDPVIRARGAVARADAGGFLGEDDAARERRALAEEARSVLEEAGDDLGLAQYWRWHGYDFWGRLQASSAAESWERALAHARKAGAKRLEVELQNYVMSALMSGPTPVAEALPLAERALQAAPEASLAQASAMRAIAVLRACEGLVDEARELNDRSRQIYLDAGLHVTAAGQAMGAFEIEWRAGDLDAQERMLRWGVQILDELRDRFFYSTVALKLAQCLLQTRQPDDEEIVALCASGRERTMEGDLVNYVYLDGIEAQRLAHVGSSQAAVELGRRAAATADTTDNFVVRSHAWESLAQTLLLAGEPDDAARAAAKSIAIRFAKGDVAGAAALERAYAELGLEPAG
jgi:tetratricopeptide (TPR) repeat protein